MAAFGNIDQDPPADVVAAAKGLVPLILASRDEGERIRRVPPEVAKALAAAGLLQMFLPRSMGGPELAPLTVFRAIEEISKADGSVGWCAMIATAASLALGWLPADIGRQFCGQPADFRCAGSLRPLGRADPVDGGYRVRGHWNFASGIDHANWLFCTCIIMEGGKPQLTEWGRRGCGPCGFLRTERRFKIHGRLSACEAPAARILSSTMFSCLPRIAALSASRRLKQDRCIIPGWFL